MFVKRFIILQLCAVCAHLGFSQAPVDTLPKTQSIQIVTITNYIYTSYKRSTDLTVAILRNKGNNLADVLQENTAIYLKNYGPGMLSTIAFRGTGAEHTALVWNGININYPMLGLADFATIPASGFKSVGVLHGSSSSNFGSSAIGGAVTLSSGPVFSPNNNFDKRYDPANGFNEHVVKTSATFEAGSYGRWYGLVSNYVGTQKFVSRTNLQVLDAANNFNYINSTKLTKPEERQVNSALKQYAFMQDFDFVTGQNSYASVKGWYNYTNRQIPPTLTTANNNAIQKDESIRLLGEWHYNNVILLDMRAAYVYDYIGYSDNSDTSKAKVSTTTLQGHVYYHLGRGFDLKGGGEGQFFTANIKEYQTYKTEWRASVFANLQYIRGNLVANLTHRQIFVQGNLTAAAPTLGIVHHFWKAGILLKANVSRSYRVPTLNERYYIPGGNPNIKPEGGWSYELGIEKGYSRTSKKTGGTFVASTEVTGFAMQVNNWLQWQPSGFGYWEPKNLKQVLSRGAELTVSGEYIKNAFSLKINGAYALSIATNQKTYTGLQNIVGKDLIYTPRNVASGGVTVAYKGYSLFVNAQYTGLRYTTTDNLQKVDPYWLLNTRASKTIKLKTFTLDVWVQAYNLTNNSYFNLPYRPMPLRNYRAGLTITFEKQLKQHIHTNEK